MSEPRQGPSEDSHSSRWDFSRQEPSSPPKTLPASNSPGAGDQALRDRRLQAPLPSSSSTFSFTMKYGRPSRSAEGIRLNVDQAQNVDTCLSGNRHAHGWKLRSNTWTQASQSYSQTMSSPTFPFPSPQGSRINAPRPATGPTISSPGPTLAPISLLETSNPRQSFRQTYERRHEHATTSPSALEQVRLSSSSGQDPPPPHHSSFSPTSEDQDPSTSQVRDDYLIAASGLVKTMSAGLSSEEAEEAPPPSLSSMFLDSRGEPRRYFLNVAEQPAHGRLCGFTTRDRRMIDPTPIVSLQIFDRNGDLDVQAMMAPHLLVQVILQATDGTDRALVINPANDTPVRVMEGVQVQNGTYVSEDKTTYFAFPDLSVRLAGRFHLLFSLISTAGTSLTRVSSQEFEVYAPRRFPGVRQSSELTRRLAERGVKVHLRNRGSSAQ
ncbi:hypothetical protein CF326_g442 [Tilletia indica]|nr:hypothetical protein CF326_g442 [Tilletia indica]